MKIALLGDTAFYGKYSVKNKIVYDYFSDVAAKLKGYDYVICNLETPFCSSDCEPFGSKSAYIHSEEDNVKLLSFLNINVVSLANNHMYDFGFKGYENTKRILSENQIEYFGIENKQIKIEKDGSKIALSGYCCYSTNGVGYFDPKKKVGVNVLDAFQVEKIMIENDNNGYLNIVSIHAGQEHVNYPNFDHVEMARKFSRKVPYIYYGHHPHVIQGIEEINDSLIAYSLGNFCFDDVYTKKSKEPLIKQSENNKKSIIIGLEIIQNKLVNYEIIPLYAGERKLEIKSNNDEIEEINEYSSSLKLNKDSYKRLRNILIAKYINERKSKRDLNWYLKRLNMTSIGIILKAKQNRLLYDKCVVEYSIDT